jgi:ribonuclease HI
MAKTKRPIIIYCDGACSGNPGRGGWGTIVLTADDYVQELGGGFSQTTNNQMELTGAIEGLRAVEKVAGPVTIYTDSSYVIRGITQWIFGWQKRGWKLAEGGEVSNKDFWQELSGLTRARPAKSIEWKYVRGHTGIPGNERCDVIAVAFTQGKSISLYEGPFSGYSHDVATPPIDEPLPEMKSFNKGPKPPAHYLSSIGGITFRHKTWGECERRVKGQSGARFKKVTSESEEKEVLKGWGVDPSKVKDE